MLRASNAFVGEEWAEHADFLDGLAKEPHWRPFHVYVHDGEGWRGPIAEFFSDSAEGVKWSLGRHMPIEAGDRFKIVPLEPRSIHDVPRDVTVTEHREFRIYDTKEPE